MVCGRKEEEAQLNFRCDLKRRAKKVFHIFLRLIILLAMSTEILDRFFTQTKGIFIRHFYHRRPP